MYELDTAVTHAINGLAGQNAAVDFLMIWTSAIGVPLLVLAVAAQWWRGTDRQHTRYVLVATGLSFLLGHHHKFIARHRLNAYEKWRKSE
ncbi:hypothetical protein [Rhizobium leguminosarum]|uniref:hypothetical protein n=1 Tax=Rhizobium leguminosarum TaxID=384 RepID=UPI001D89317F|nr:hypothetical protein [Rhizobium leguminosarum]MBP2443161.1 hypothetical protein [Rhizobium leguminosarum]